ncbi:MAG: hypothetical protein AB1772_13495, partial [Candidatus Zixiibacteriota bacterium]
TIALDNICQKPKTNVQLCAWVTDKDTPLASLTVNLFYRNSPASSYTSVATTRTDSTFCATVPSSQLLCTGDSIQYYFTASDGEHTVGSPPTAPVGHHAFPICPTNANAGPDKQLTCSVTQVQLSGSSTTTGVTFSWLASNGGHIVSGGSTATPTVDAAGTYVLTVTDPTNNCTGKDTALVTLNTTKPVLSCLGDTLTCDSTQATASVISSPSVGVTYLWTPAPVSGQGTSAARYNTSGAKKVVVTITATGCKDSCTATIVQNIAVPNANAGSDKVLTCLVTQINLSGSSSTPGATFSWGAFSGGHIVSGGNTATPLVDAAGTYILTVRNPVNHCSAQDTAIVIIDRAKPVLTCTGDELTCDSLLATASVVSNPAVGVTYAWNPAPI